MQNMNTENARLNTDSESKDLDDLRKDNKRLLEDLVSNVEKELEDIEGYREQAIKSTEVLSDFLQKDEFF